MIALCGATGHVGGRVARLLAERGVEQRLVVRDPARMSFVGAAPDAAFTLARHHWATDTGIPSVPGS